MTRIVLLLFVRHSGMFSLFKTGQSGSVTDKNVKKSLLHLTVRLYFTQRAMDLSDPASHSYLSLPRLAECETNRIYHRSLMQTKKSQPEDKRVMLETRFTEFPALSVDPRVRISRSASQTDD